MERWWPSAAVDHSQNPLLLDKDFAEKSLKDSNNYQDFRVLSIDVQRASALGENFMSEIYRMAVELEHKVKQHKEIVSLIVKLFPGGEVMQKIAQDMQAFEREILMFSETIPAMTQMLQKAAPGKYTQLSATFFTSGTQPVIYVVLEDLKARGFAMAERCKGLDLAHAKLVVRKLAEFHASSIALYTQNPASMDKYKSFQLFEGETGKHTESFLKLGCKGLADQLETLEKSYSQYAPRVRALSENLYPRLAEMAKQKGKFCALAHADTWTNNIMFKYSGSAVQDVVLLDFQVSCYYSPSIDLHHFIHTSITEQVYADHLTDLLKEYYNRLMEVMKDIGISRDKQISYEEVLEDFEAHMLYGLYIAITELPVVRSEGESGFDVEASMKGTYTDDNRSAFTGAVYMQAIKHMLPEFEKRGLL
ncbi:uncharacterized protein LOC126092910 [Schistocerca cancellata]|uniref:uncharacterized protein LOC126092910 n=1 Tax=Schistocerca cancellata TaxID=274614 RepID=UPI0021181874|nr:uncharacterized protein LOC126092910 [Schistocerca cancellata]